MERKKKPDGTYRFPFLVTFIGWLIEMLIFGNLGVFQQIPAPTLLSSLALLTVGWWLGMFGYSLLGYLYFQNKNKKR